MNNKTETVPGTRAVHLVSHLFVLLMSNRTSQERKDSEGGLIELWATHFRPLLSCPIIASPEEGPS